MDARRSKRSTLLALIGLPAIAGVVVLGIHHETDAARNISAQNAALNQIVYQLTDWPSGKPYPDSLSKLSLTYPDGGDASILEKFEYRSSGTNCTLRTRLGGKETVWSFA
jgi:hypothetical protein